MAVVDRRLTLNRNTAEVVSITERPTNTDSISVSVRETFVCRKKVRIYGRQKNGKNFKMTKITF